MSDATIGFAPRIEPEDSVRADMYALFARLYFSAPDSELLRMIGTAPLLSDDTDSGRLAVSWARLCAACRVMDADAALDEYEGLFGGIGKPAISLYGSYYASAQLPGSAGQFLVDLRAHLSGLGLGLQRGLNLPEDHLSGLFETMRILVAGSQHSLPRTIADQHAFFERFVASWYVKCCTAIGSAALANFYRTVAECTEAFLAVEDASFAIA